MNCKADQSDGCTHLHDPNTDSPPLNVVAMHAVHPTVRLDQTQFKGGLDFIHRTWQNFKIDQVSGEQQQPGNILLNLQ